MSEQRPQFLFAVCQLGAEGALKFEIAREWPSFRLAYSRPGFVTFKLPADFSQPDDFDLKSVFSRTHGFSLGKVVGANPGELAVKAWTILAGHPLPNLHVWQRDTALPGDFEYEPGLSQAARIAGEHLLASCPWSPEEARPGVNEVIRSGQSAVDCVLVEPNEWWLGYHRAASVPSRWPGGLVELPRPEHMISRAYLKMSEALEWSRLPVRPDDLCLELGAAPGGSCQALLERGLRVWGVDPANVHEQLINNPKFVHWRRRAAEIKKRDLADFRWLTADLNVAPKYTLDAVEQIVTHRAVQIRGMLLTLKLPTWDLAPQIPEYLSRIRSWGYEYVRARQLAFNRHEICVAVLKSRSMRRLGS